MEMIDRKKVMSWLEGPADIDWLPYHSNSEVRNIAKAALELLREQEPRVLSLEEVMNSPDRLMWLQYKSANAVDGYEMHPTAPYGDDWPKGSSVSFQSGHIQTRGLYGKQWRCWTSKPNKEEAVRWEEGKL